MKDGALYQQKHTRNGAIVKIAISWVFSFLLYGPAIIAFDIWRGHSTVEDQDCDVEFATDFWYTMASAIIEFLVPAVLLVSFNFYIFWKIRQKTVLKMKRDQTKSVISMNGNGHSNPAFSAPTGDIISNKESQKRETENKLPNQQRRPGEPMDKNSSICNDHNTTSSNSVDDTDNKDVQGNGILSHFDISFEEKRDNDDLLSDASAKTDTTNSMPASVAGNTDAGENSAATLSSSLPTMNQTDANSTPVHDASQPHNEVDEVTTNHMVVTDSMTLPTGQIRRETDGVSTIPSPPPAVVVGPLSNGTNDLPNIGRPSASASKFISLEEKNMKRYRKAARSLGVLVIAFSICWLPYTVSTVTLSICDTCISEDLYEAFSWLLWLNSSINPLLYAAMNPRFRNHYKRLLCSWHICPRARNKKSKDQDPGSVTVEI